MKRIIFLALIIFALSSSFAYGEVQEFAKFSMDIPADWTAKEEGVTVSVSKNDNSASILVTISELGQLTLEQIAEKNRQFNGFDYCI